MKGFFSTLATKTAKGKQHNELIKKEKLNTNKTKCYCL